jgi:hypothetical protein
VAVAKLRHGCANGGGIVSVDEPNNAVRHVKQIARLPSEPLQFEAKIAK